MRASYLIVGGILVLAAVLLSTRSTFVFPRYEKPVPPGQFPLNATRPSWPATESVGYYRPTGVNEIGEIGSDLFFGRSRDAKFRCGTENGCALATV